MKLTLAALVAALLLPALPAQAKETCVKRQLRSGITICDHGATRRAEKERERGDESSRRSERQRERERESRQREERREARQRERLRQQDDAYQDRRARRDRERRRYSDYEDGYDGYDRDPYGRGRGGYDDDWYWNDY